MADLKGRVAVVAGVGGGIGRGIAAGLAEAGATIYFADHASVTCASVLEATAAEVLALGGVGVSVPLDPADPAQITTLFKRIEAEAGRLDLLVAEAWRLTPGIRLMQQTGAGLIVNIRREAEQSLGAESGSGLASQGVTALWLLDVQRHHLLPRYVGRCVAALSMDPDVQEKNGGRFTVAELAREYRFSEPPPAFLEQEP
jgi:NAD(P)-dependent dehydrogenase (short-subunit alcohol dehydrogenase family)